ncbi:MAG: DNA recombination protein RmuC [Rikenellaceae bacterium]|nr:DNA recombination protein RmuC [Rikenellaceae bacterium]
MNIGILILLIVLALVAVVATMLTVTARRDAQLLRAERSRLEGEIGVARQTQQTEAERRQQAEQQLSALRAASEKEIENLKARAEEVKIEERKRREEEIEHLKSHFKSLSAEILSEQSKQFRETNKESMDVLLKPFRDNITEFRQRVEVIYSHENEQRGELKNELQHLLELNRRITTETTNLTNALKGNSKVQGDWGETMLEAILDSSSLVKGIHYSTQQNLKDTEGNNLRPDVILQLPEQKQIVIDSKVSLTAYVDYTNAESEAERNQHLTAHVASVRKHVRELGNKEYQKLLNSPDMVVMFVANEPAFLEALKADPTLWSEAYDKKVLISSPTNLFALLKMVADLWKYDAQDKNTKRIADCGLKLYEQAVALTASLEQVGASLSKAQAAYNDAHKRLTSGNNNIVRVGEQLKKTARLQSKKEFSAALSEAVEENEEE